MPSLSAETVYLFRHALLREGAYQLQLPADRAALHALSLELIEAVLGDHADEAATELARHARFAWQTGTAENTAELQGYELRWSLVALRQAQARFDGDAEVALADAVIESPVANGEQRCDACYQRANTLQRLGRWQEARDDFHRLAQLAERQASVLYRGHAIYGLGYLDWLGGHVDDCDRRLEEWLQLTREMDNEHELASAMLAIGMMRFNRGDVKTALDVHQQWLPRLKKTADEKTLLRNLFNFGVLLQESGHFAQAEEAYREALRLARACSQRDHEGSILGSLGTLCKVRRQYDQALEFLNESVRIAQEVGNRRGRAIQLTNIGTVYQQLGRTREALETYENVVREAMELSALSTYASARGNIGLACLQLGRCQEAVAQLRESAELWQRLKDASWEAYTRCGLARALRMSGAYDAAAGELAAGRGLLEGMESVLDEFMLRCEAAHLALARGESGTAEHAAVREVFDSFDEAYSQAAAQDLVQLEQAMRIAAAGGRLVHGACREHVSNELLKAIEG